MKGSEKQIKWAEDIRKQALTALTEEAAKAYAEREGVELDYGLLKDYVQKIKTCEDSRYFIDIVRNYPGGDSTFYQMEVDDEEWSEVARETLGLV